MELSVYLNAQKRLKPVSTYLDTEP